MAFRRAAAMASVATVASAGGTIKLAWSDCGDSSTHGHITSLSPDTVKLGTSTPLAGKGTVDENISGANYKVTAKALGITVFSHSGDGCKPDTIKLPAGAGEISFKGFSCPMKPGAVELDLGLSLAASIPAQLARTTIDLTATATGGDKALCVQIKTSPAMMPGERDFSDYTYEDFLQEFGKNYVEEEQSARKATFLNNLDRIRQHNADPSKTFYMTVNEFADLTNEEFRSKRMGNIPELDESHFVGEYVPSKNEDLPDSVDWRTKEGVMTPVKDQGGCGSCWAFSTVETLESHLAIATGEAAPILSPQQIVSCAPNPNACGGTGGCDGSIQTLGFNYTKTAGITTEANYRYSGTTGTCEQSKIKPVATNDGYVKLKVNDYTSLVSAVATKGPIAISLAAGGFGWQLYGGGVLTKCDCVQDHAVQLVGYGTDAKSGHDYWLVRNSWAAGWGEKGYIRIQRFGEGKEPTCIDKKPQDGEACKGDTKPRTYAGMCGIIGSSSYPTGMKKTTSEVVV
jgi:cathepsin L